MQIDWTTFSFQVANFLVLVWLLKRFLYGPILKAIDDREQRITDRLKSAADREAAAAAAQQGYERQQAELAHLKESQLADAAVEVDQWKQDRLAELSDEAAETRRVWQAAVAREKQQLLGELRERTAQQVQNVTRHVLRELADHNLEQQTIQRFLTHLDGMADEESLLSRNGHESRPVVVRTAFPLSPDDESALTEDLAARMQAAAVRFEVDPNLVCGIEVVASDHKLEWNVDNYLDSLEHSIAAALDQHAATTRAASLG